MCVLHSFICMQGQLVTALFIIIGHVTRLPEFKANGVDLSKPVAAMCGSGVTACWPIFTAHLCNQKEMPLYDVGHMIVT